jgi:hypothetical protein
VPVLQAVMQKDILASLARLSDDDLAVRVKSLAAREHATAASVIAHLAEMDTRDIHLRAGYPRLYDYCLKVLHLSEWEAWNRIEAGRVARRFPVLFDMLEEGSIHLTGIKLLAPHLTEENHRSVLHSARWKSKLAIGEIVARLHPLPDVPTSVVPILEFGVAPPPVTASGTPPIVPPAPPARPATLTPLSPRRYKLQLTISGETLEKLRRAKDLLGHVVAAGDDDAVLNRAQDHSALNQFRNKSRGFSCQRCRVGTQAVVRPPIVSCTMGSARAVRASARRPQRWWKSQVAGKRSESPRRSTARRTMACSLRRRRETSPRVSEAAGRRGLNAAW